ncbi:MAG: HEAT repeat domain-containing protein [Vicinamibacterales bacterium]
MTTIRRIAAVTPEDLRANLLGQRATLPRRDAIVGIADSGLADREHLLRLVLSNASESPLNRAHAAAGLASVATPSALQALVRTAREAEPVVLMPAIQLLGRVGGEAERQVLEQISALARGTVADHARTAAALIAYRHRLDAPGLADQRMVALPLADGDRVPFEVSRPAAAEAERCRQSLDAERFRWPVAPEHAVGLRCRARAMIVSMDPEFLTTRGVASLRHRKALLAVVATRIEDGDRYSASHLVLADPGRGAQIRLRVCRPSGRLVLMGEGSVAERVSFTLGSIERPGAVAVGLGGQFGLDGVTIERAEASARVHGKVTLSFDAGRPSA